ncbi:MAG: IS110 family transposase [Oscillospiraceae bacterium]
MKVVFPTCCGVDVHKTFVVATIITTPADSLQPHYQKKRFSTFNSDLNRFADWLLEHNCLDVCMESTGKYWVPVFNILEKRGIRVVIANPKWVKAVKGNKDDTKDSKWIGDLFRIGLVKSSFIPELNIRILREFLRYRYKLVSMKSSEKNRFQNAFTVCNVAWILLCPICLVNPQLQLRTTSHPMNPLTRIIVFPCYSAPSKRRLRKFWSPLKATPFLTSRRLAIKIIREHYDFIEKLIAKVDTCVK